METAPVTIFFQMSYKFFQDRLLPVVFSLRAIFPFPVIILHFAPAAASVA
jgi:hypothetical protein